jgi:hypothetical protein
MLGDLMMVGVPPGKLIKALVVIADTLHQEYSRQPWIAHPDTSKDSCVLCALTVRDFLRKIGFEDARAIPVCVAMQATKNGELLHSLGIGHPEGARKEKGRWPGHLVVTVPSAGYLIDSVLYGARRRQWPHLPGMMAVPLQPGAISRVFGLEPLAGIQSDAASDSYEFTLVWLDNPDNMAWRQGKDAREKWRRKPVVKAMLDKFGVWHD